MLWQSVIRRRQRPGREPFIFPTVQLWWHSLRENCLTGRPGEKRGVPLVGRTVVSRAQENTHTHTQNPPPKVVPTWIRTLGCTWLMCRRTSGSALRHAPYFTRRHTHPGCTHSVLSARKHIEPKPHWNTNGLPKERARTSWLTHSDTERGFLARAPYGQVWCLIDQGEREEATGTLHICACQQYAPEGEWGDGRRRQWSAQLIREFKKRERKELAVTWWMIWLRIITGRFIFSHAHASCPGPGPDILGCQLPPHPISVKCNNNIDTTTESAGTSLLSVEWRKTEVC